MALNWSSSNQKLTVDKSSRAMFPGVSTPTHRRCNGEHVRHKTLGHGVVVYQRKQSETFYTVGFASGRTEVVNYRHLHDVD